jgi:hypothetical protein
MGTAAPTCLPIANWPKSRHKPTIWFSFIILNWDSDNLIKHWHALTGHKTIARSSMCKEKWAILQKIDKDAGRERQRCEGSRPREGAEPSCTSYLGHWAASMPFQWCSLRSWLEWFSDPWYQTVPNKTKVPRRGFGRLGDSSNIVLILSLGKNWAGSFIIPTSAQLLLLKQHKIWSSWLPRGQQVKIIFSDSSWKVSMFSLMWLYIIRPNYLPISPFKFTL